MSEDFICKCGLPMSLNPHPFAGHPREINNVGAAYVCIPCTFQNRRRHIDARLKVEAERDDIKEYLRLISINVLNEIKTIELLKVPLPFVVSREFECLTGLITEAMEKYSLAEKKNG